MENLPSQNQTTYGSLNYAHDKEALQPFTTATTSTTTSSRTTALIREEAAAAAAHDDTCTNTSTSSSAQNNNALLILSSQEKLRTLAIQASLITNIVICMIKTVAYARTRSLSVLAALVDSLLDVASQFVLYITEHYISNINENSKAADNSSSHEHYPAGAARLEPVGVLTCAALMGIASFEVLQQSWCALYARMDYYEHDENNNNNNEGYQDHSNDFVLDIQFSSVLSMLAIVVVKLGLLKLCRFADHTISCNNFVTDSTLDTLAQDHWNDALSNFIAAAALMAAYMSPKLWFLDPLGGITISLYIIFSWYITGKEQIEQLIGKAAPADFIDELMDIAAHHDDRMTVDVCRAYHFGPKFLVELEVVLPADMPLMESHDIGMELQYQIEGREEVERCFVHIDYEKREYDEHVVSKVPELLEKYGIRHRSSSSSSNNSQNSADANV